MNNTMSEMMNWMRNAVKREDGGGTHVREHRALEGKKQGATEASAPPG